tara:strand:- start:1081 stop:1632 length:552 start_codon:yes stop_codon:yes gene_type:complete
MASLIEELRPQWVIGENVRGFVNEPLGLKRSLSDLESIGYQAVPFVIPACAVDAPHRRDRVWIVGNTKRSRFSGVNRRGSGKEPENRCEDVADADSPQEGLVVNTDDERFKGCSEKQVCRGGTQPRKFIGTGEGCAQFWATEPAVGRVADGIPRRVDRIKALGNAVVPQVVAQIGKAIIEAER